jgi:hypothetical protein
MHEVADLQDAQPVEQSAHTPPGLAKVPLGHEAPARGRRSARGRGRGSPVMSAAAPSSRGAALKCKQHAARARPARVALCPPHPPGDSPQDPLCRALGATHAVHASSAEQALHVAGHVSQAPVALSAKLPTGQLATQADALASSPASHVVQAVAEVQTSQPAAQGLQARAAASRYHPDAGQLSTQEEPLNSTVPSEHAEQVVAEEHAVQLARHFAQALLGPR